MLHTLVPLWWYRERELNLKLCCLLLQLTHFVSVVNEADIALPGQWTTINI